MTRDHGLEELVREALAGLANLDEKMMFGGRVWLLDGNLLCGARHDGLLMRLGKGNDEWALALPDVAPMHSGARRMHGWCALALMPTATTLCAAALSPQRSTSCAACRRSEAQIGEPTSHIVGDVHVHAHGAFPLSFLTLAALFLVAVVAAAFDAIAGGGGLITLPALLTAGLDPVAALATNKLQSSGGSVSATIVFARRGLVPWRVAWAFALAAGLAAIAGAFAAALMPRAILQAMVPIILLAVAAYFAFARRPAEADTLAHSAGLAIAWCAGIGFYDGIFGPGAGSFYMIGFVALMGCGLVRATAQTKLANAASNLGALAFFVLTGKVVWVVGLVMAAGAFLGGQIGSRLALRHGARIIRPLVVTICCALALRLLADPANPLRQAFAALRAHML